MSSILVAIDGSAHSYKVVDEAIALAKEIGAKIILMHVIPRIEVPTEFLEFMKTERIEVSPEYLYSTKVGEEILQRFGERVAASGVEYDTIVEVGDVAERVIAIAEARKPRYIVIGLTGLHGIRRAATLGSIARRIIEGARIPVIVVPHAE